MLELLILYSLNKQELTLYGLKKYIAEYFGVVSNPSHGALHPALKRLMAKNIVNIRKNISDGGKRYTYYSLSSTWKDFFDDRFMQFNSSKTETLDAYLVELKTKLLLIDLVDKNLLDEFKEKNILKLNSYKKQTEETLNNPYIELSENQKKYYNTSLAEANLYLNCLKEVE